MDCVHLCGVLAMGLLCADDGGMGCCIMLGKVFGIPLEQVVLNTCDQSAGSASVQLPPILVCPCEQIEARGTSSDTRFCLLFSSDCH